MMRSRYSGAMPLAALALAGMLSLWLGRRAATQSPPDHAAAGQTVFEYLHALEKQEARRLIDLLPEDSDVEADIDDRLRRFGGSSVAQAEVEIASARSPEVLAVTIRTIGLDAQQLSWTENMVWHQGAWKLVLGSARDLPCDATTPSTQE